MRTETAVRGDDLIAAWRELMQSGEKTPDDALTTREICSDVLGWHESDYFINRTRRIINDWLGDGLVERVDVKRISISGYDTTVKGYRLINFENEREGRRVS